MPAPRRRWRARAAEAWRQIKSTLELILELDREQRRAFPAFLGEIWAGLRAARRTN